MTIPSRSLYVALAVSLVTASPGSERVSFSDQIRPILSDRCFACHGFDDETREADLGLHLFGEATRDLGGYRAITPGDPGASEVMARLLTDDPDDMMPPPSSNKPRLTPEEVALVKKWIEQGAEYEMHWSFRKPVKPEVPAGEAASEIDRFLDSRLATTNLPVNGTADPHTLIRRLSLDLRGIPPTREEVEAFVAADRRDAGKAWQEWINRFLDSKHYGIHWARSWLDLARYADTNGYEKDRPRSVWPYRDWVVDALNDDMPYDRFSIEQLAGDMLPDPTVDQLVATGFHRNTMLNEEGGIDPLEFRYHAMVDRVATTGAVWMGLTTGCAQCHTHKFDPITHTDYFAMMALLNNAEEPTIEVPVPELVEKREAIDREISAILKEAVGKIDGATYQRWREERRKKTAVWRDLRPEKVVAEGLLATVEAGDAVYVSGDFTKRDVYHLEYDLSEIEDPVTAIRLEALPDPRLPGGGPGAAYYEGRSGDFFLSELSAEADGTALEFADGSVSFGKIAVGSGTAEGMNVFDRKGSTGWSTATQNGRRNELVVNLAKPVSIDSLKIRMLFERHFVAALGKFRFSVTTDRGEVKAIESGLPDPYRTPDAELREAFVRHSAAFEATQKQIAALEKRKPALPATLVMKERPPENPRKTFRHHRGEYLSPREEVQPAVPAIFDPIPEEEKANRIGFARWLVSERNPLVARVAVNRAWRAFFGAGLLRTSADFGYQSELPDHPELLDWLAVTFVEDGWSMKSLHRRIVSSEAYRRSSAVDSLQQEADPDNRLLARGPRFRMTGEMLRDSVLQSAGILSAKEGGPGVYPPQPASVIEMAYGKVSWNVSKGEDRYRRSLYTFLKRTAPFAAYQTFDGITGESCIPRRDRSNTPLQALTLMNDPMFGEAAEAIAGATGLCEEGNPVESPRVVEDLFYRILARPPSEQESRDFVDYFTRQRDRIAAGELDAGELLDSPPENHAGVVAAWKMVARVLMNLNETVTKG